MECPRNGQDTQNVCLERETMENYILGKYRAWKNGVYVDITLENFASDTRYVHPIFKVDCPFVTLFKDTFFKIYEMYFESGNVLDFPVATDMADEIDKEIVTILKVLNFISDTVQELPK